jgi:hypothetical protein
MLPGITVAQKYPILGNLGIITLQAIGGSLNLEGTARKGI